MARDLCRVIDSASPEPVALVGHSFGGAVALRYTIDHPERVSHLILVETPLPIMSPDSLQFFFAQSLDTLAGLLPESQQQTLTQSKRPGRLSRQILELITHTSMNEDILAEPDISDDELSQIAAPVLLCYGTRSALGPADRERLLRALPNARLEMLEGGHFLPNERPDEIAALIEAFLNG
jgi:pimeloyl-ACP methyl ester carboxylesterase